MCFFNRGSTEGTNSSNILRLMFVYVLFYVNLCWHWFCCCWEFVVWWRMCMVNRRQIGVCFSPDVIRCGWLGSKYQLTKKPRSGRMWHQDRACNMRHKHTPGSTWHHRDLARCDISTDVTRRNINTGVGTCDISIFLAARDISIGLAACDSIFLAWLMTLA